MLGIAKEFLATFSAAYLQAYGVEVARVKLNEIEEEARGDNKPKKELKYREVCGCMCSLDLSGSHGKQAA